ncbi:MAG: 50S ribosomal protein L6 [Candidatus Harrisonbacteria bacterium CG10_big_fil_rev_8_21_14_0_10_44_23]|uniref:Large ribosomal subunit protein uL6 n=1 Tax=Candidatus Harrisonbacteria bacterium CG10_big_fil_rev_8_21_14_0_10_44_23 TaxID=1974585 RepID=A0A2H0UQQ4_9BACT|nr:MAG: 50S ribosomal protein L6 [Candidatus Harrisonbacteria bacterium CG10_big_fil_rev_8_21_14_0_10_44_23]
MSKIGKKPIVIPEGVEVKQDSQSLHIKGKKGEQIVVILPYVDVEIKDNEIHCSIKKAHKQARSNWGTCASLIENAVQGVNEGYEKGLEVEGVGFRVAMQGRDLQLNIGFSHPVKYVPPEGVEIRVEDNKMFVSGVSKQAVGHAAAEIRALKKPEPYKGKGIHYIGEQVRRKAGKKVGSE